VSVDCRWWEASVVRGRILAAGLVLLGAGCAVLGLSARSRQTHPAVASASGAVTLPGLQGQRVSVPVDADAQIRAHSVLAGLPLIFEPNQGQGNLDPSDPRAKFVARGSGYSLFLGSQGAIVSLVSPDHNRTSNKGRSAATPVLVQSLEMKLAGANANLRLSATDPLPGHSNYLLGNDPAKWHRGVPQFGRVRYENAYPGIDLVFYGNQGRLEYDFQVAPGADPTQAELEFDGAKRLEVQDGALVIHSEGESVRLEAPKVYQEIAGRKQAVEGSFVVRGANRAGFAIGAYDRSRELVIDPILNFSTYFGGSGDEHSTSVAVDGSFNIYITGSTTSPNLPVTSGVVQSTLAGTQNAYVAKITPPLGSIVAALDYVTYLGGNGIDSPVGIKVDSAGNAFVAGTTSSTNFPTTPTTAYQTGPESGSTGTSHVFVTELNSGPTPAAATELLYSSYLSGNGTDVASGMTIDSLGNVFVTGTTTSQDVASTTDQFPASTLPQALAYQTTPRSSIQFFVTKLNTQASRTGSIAFSTYFGGGNFQTTTPIAEGGGIAVDLNGNIYFSGTTNFTYTGCSQCGTTDFPILNAYQPCLDTAPPTTVTNPASCTSSTSATESDAFVAKINPAGGQGQQLLWSTYLGGSQTDSSTGVALDTGAANVYVVGTTNSQDFVASTTLATFASYQKCLNNLPVTTTGTVTCTTQTDPAPTDAFVARVSNPTNTTGTPTNVSLGYFSYLGGSNNEAGTAITVDSAAGALITGWTQSPVVAPITTAGNFPVQPYPNSIQSALNGTQDAFVARLNTQAVIGQTTIASWANYFGGSGIDSGTGIALDVNQDTYLAGETNSTDLPVSKPLPTNTTNAGGYDAFVTQLGTAVSLSIQGVLTLGANQTFISAGNQATFTYTVTNNGPDLATGITISDNLSSSITGVNLSFNSASTSSGTCGGISTQSVVSCTLGQLQSGSTATVTIVVTPNSNSSGSQASFNGGTVQAMAPGNFVLAQTTVPATMSDFAMSVGPNNYSVPAAGQTAFYGVDLKPNPIYTSAISLSCTGQPTGASCNFTPSSGITLQSTSGQTATLGLTTTARPVVTPAAILLPRQFYALFLLVPGLMFFGGGRRRRRIAGILMLCTMFALLLLLPACSHTNTQIPTSGTPAGTYTITVTAASGTDSKSQTVTLTVP
jgi:uncharacterized repeat protein (TIGR01451 family)